MHLAMARRFSFPIYVQYKLSKGSFGFRLVLSLIGLDYNDQWKWHDNDGFILSTHYHSKRTASSCDPANVIDLYAIPRRLNLFGTLICAFSANHKNVNAIQCRDNANCNWNICICFKSVLQKSDDKCANHMSGYMGAECAENGFFRWFAHFVLGKCLRLNSYVLIV